MKSTRFSRPKGHFGTALTFSVPFGLLGLGGWNSARSHWLGRSAAGVGDGNAFGDVDWGGAHGGARSELAEPAGALSGARLYGSLVLGSELYGKPDSVARAGASTAAGREDAGGGVAFALTWMGDFVTKTRHHAVPRHHLAGTSGAPPSMAVAYLCIVDVCRRFGYCSGRSVQRALSAMDWTG